MIDYHVFYKAIGIAENIIDPSYYHILGLDWQGCDRQAVQRAFAEKQRQLRQSIPSPEFIMPMLQFESQVLEKAAEVLSDETQRAAYNQQLMERQREIESKNQKKQKLIEDVRAAVAEAVDEKGMLGGVERYLLEEKLRLLEVQEHNIKQILARIPEPSDVPVFDQQRLLMFFAGAVQLSITENTLGRQEEEHLIDLAHRLGVQEPQARSIIDQQLKQLAAHREGVVCEGIVLERPIRMDDATPPKPREERSVEQQAPAAPVEMPPENIEQTVGQMRRVTLDGVLQWIVPILSIAVFILTVFFLNAMSRKRNAVPDARDLLPEVQPSEPTVKPAEKKQTIPAQAPERSRSEKTSPPQPASVSPEVPQVESLSRQETYELCSGQASDDAILADCVMLMMAICRRASDFQAVPDRISSDLRKVSSSVTERIEIIQTLADEQGVKVRAENARQETVLLRLDELKKILHSDSESARHYAIRRLASMKHLQVYNTALEALEDTTINTKSQTVTLGLLAICAQSNSPSVADKLAEMIARATQQKAFLIERTLMEMTGISPAGRGGLSLKNTLQQRQDAAARWRDQLWSWTPPQPAEQSTKQVYSFEQTLLLEAMIAHFARQAADLLSGDNLADDEVFLQRLRFKYGFDHPDLDRLKLSPAAATDFLAEAVEQLMRQRSPNDAAGHAAALDQKVHLLACSSDLQIAAVNLSAVIDSLAILAETADTQGRYRQLLTQFRETYQTEKENARGDDCRLRVVLEHTVRFWDLLLQVQGERQQ